MSGRLMATDSQQQELLVADFDTALGTLPHARLRTSDVVAVTVPLETVAAPRQPEPEPEAAASDADETTGTDTVTPT